MKASTPDADFIAFQEAVAGRYSLERELGRGGMGIVYLARELRLARPVAIKVLPRLLAERVRARGPLSPAEGARVLREIGWALAYAHSRGIVHRDVKPDNILLERGTNRALVTDFGIAGAVSSGDAADANYVRGTAHFLSPEQAMGQPTDGRSDIYSLGVVGYYVLTGHLPFDGATTVQVMAAHIAGRPKPMQGFAPHVPRKLAGAVERCIERNRERRWPTGEAFAEAVDAAFEQPREIPAPLRVWLSKDAEISATRIVGTLALLGPFAVVVKHSPVIGVAAGTVSAVALNFGPQAVYVRRLLRQGFSLADMRAALRTHVLRRREEIELDPAFTPIRQTTLRNSALTCLGIAAVSSVLLAGNMVTGSPLAELLSLVDAVTAAVGIGCTVGALGARPRAAWLRTYGQRRLDFWNSTWGERLTKLAGLGLKRTAIASASLPRHTEIALGRATDALFEALPRKMRRDLKAVPATVRRLETAASALRDSLDTLDDLLAKGDDAELQRQRDHAAEMLSATVTALENIRLGLLRLQLGAAPVAQVTEALEAASRIGYEIDLALDAENEIGDVLKPKRIANRDPEPSPV